MQDAETVLDVLRERGRRNCHTHGINHWRAVMRGNPHVRFGPEAPEKDLLPACGHLAGDLPVLSRRRRFRAGVCQGVRLFPVPDEDLGQRPDVAQIQIAALRESVRLEITDARAGRYVRHDGKALALLNVWHPTIADWTPLYELLEEPRIIPTSLFQVVRSVRDASARIEDDIRDALLPLLERLRDRPPIDRALWRPNNRELANTTREAIDALSPGAIADSDLWRLIGGDNEQRCAAARIVGRRRDPARLDILACVAQDDVSVVRATAAHWLASWLDNDLAVDKCNALLTDLVRSPGTLVARAIVDGLSSETGRQAAGDWFSTLRAHPSSAVRLQAAE